MEQSDKEYFLDVDLMRLIILKLKPEYFQWYLRKICFVQGKMKNSQSTKRILCN
jgi:hypothetical protein